MRLAAFIRTNLEQIAAEWELFAGTLLPDREFSKLVLRDDIIEMLIEIADNMDGAQSAYQQRQKSEGDAKPNQTIDQAAGKHALQRLQMGLSTQQLISEFRALRATIIRLWQREDIAIENVYLSDLIRLNEAVDQLLAQAAMTHAVQTDRSRDMFLAILGHDLKNPLMAISGWTEMLLRVKTADRYEDLVSQILASSARMTHLVTDLIEMTRVRLGSGIVIKPAQTNMRRICVNAIEEMEAINPTRHFRLACDNEFAGEWDEARMTQVLSNLLGNAIQHGAVSLPVAVTVERDGNGLAISVHNEGIAIPPDMLPKLFDSLFQAGSTGRSDDDHSSSLGLGLYVAKEIILAHKGTIEVRSSDDEGTTFVAHLPSAEFALLSG